MTALIAIAAALPTIVTGGIAAVTYRLGHRRGRRAGFADGYGQHRFDAAMDAANPDPEVLLVGNDNSDLRIVTDILVEHAHEGCDDSGCHGTPREVYEDQARAILTALADSGHRPGELLATGGGGDR
ncbi:hypothetical protein NE236_41550 [Actinoallomurus purpureus]|uniref:hypothetical protein n=1 Tax=Actinoallomurus purpureus TaxID=478114 RepID=UPI0020936ED2|nr:hypothetical protein [Actinoallomurus purpureus]MCO6011455.1 hypothetical protein [Actinoallomurus purpureus]